MRNYTAEQMSANITLQRSDSKEKKNSIYTALKQKLMVLTLLIACLYVIVPSINAFASYSYPYASQYGYVEMTAWRGAAVYNNTTCTRRGTTSPYRNYNASVSTGDTVYIYQINGSSNYCKVSYPVGSSRRIGYCKVSVLLGAYSCADYKSSSPISSTVYKNYNCSTYYGSIASGDQVWCIGRWTSTNTYEVIYTAKSGNRSYKIGWITKSTYDSIFNSTANSGNEVSVSSGTYYISTSLNTNYVLDVNNYATFNGGNVEIYPYHGTNNEHWKITSLGNGYYRIQDVNSGKSLDVNGGSSSSGTNVQIWESNNSNAQKWKFYNAGNGYYYIRNANGCYLDVYNGSVSNGNNVWVYTGNGSGAQKWKLTGVSVSSSSSSTNSNSVTARLDLIANGNLTYGNAVLKVGSTFTGTRSNEQCKGYAKNVFYLCFKIMPNSTQSNNYLLNSTSGMTRVGYSTNISSTTAKSLFSKGRPGDFIQVSRRSTGGPHSMIIYSVSSTGITVLEANIDGKNGIYKNFYTWSQLATKNKGMSLYTATDYRLK